LGDVVTLEVAGGDDRMLSVNVPTRVKSVKRLATRQLLFEIAVELVSPDNIWGVATPPEDWFCAQEPRMLAPSNADRGLQIVPRTEQMTARKPALPAPIFGLQKDAMPTELPPFLALLVASLSEQIVVAARESIRAAVAKEASQLLSELRLGERDGHNH